MKSVNYTKKHHMYLMNHTNGDVIEVKTDKNNKSFKKLRLFEPEYDVLGLSEVQNQ